MAIDERARVAALFQDLVRAPQKPFPPSGHGPDAPTDLGVYVICSPHKKIVHVGQTQRGKAGIRQRLLNHLYGQSSFTEHYLDGEGSRLRKGYTFRCLIVRNARLRALLEAYAIGQLCPAHIGTGQAER